MMKRIISLCSILALIVSMCSLFSGCDKNSEPSGDKDVVNISLLIQGYPIEDHYKYHDEVQEAINEKLYKDLGFKVNVITTSYIDQFETMLALDMAANVNYDMIRASSSLAVTYGQKNSFAPLNDLLDQYGQDIKAAVPASAFAENSFEGKIYGIPTCSFPASYGLWIRGDWLKKLGKSIPTNISELEALMNDMKTNSELNAKNKVIPMAGSRDFMEMIFLGMFTEHPGDYVDENGKIRPKYLDPGYRQFTEKIADWYQKGYIDSLLLNGDENAINDLISKDRVGIHAGNVFQLEYATLASYDQQKNLDMKWVLPFASETKSYYSPGVGSDVVVFPTSSKNKEKAMQYYNWYYNNKENSDLVLYGIKDKTYTVSTDAETGKEIISIPENEITDKIKQPMDLIGHFGTNVNTSLQLLYTYSTRKAESSRAYDSCNTPEILNNYHMDVTRYFSAEMPGTLGTKYGDSKEMMITRVSEMMTGKRKSTDAEWADMENKWKELGGQEVYDWYTEQYNKEKANLSFLSK